MNDLFAIVFASTIGGFCFIPFVALFFGGDKVYWCCEKLFRIGAYLGLSELAFFMLASIIQAGGKL
jgi:hypothetical protein